MSLELETIEGVGPKTIEKIYKKYGYIDKLKDISAEDLSNSIKISQKTAQRIIDAL